MEQVQDRSPRYTITRASTRLTQSPDKNVVLSSGMDQLAMEDREGMFQQELVYRAEH